MWQPGLFAIDGQASSVGSQAWRALATTCFCLRNLPIMGNLWQNTAICLWLIKHVFSIINQFVHGIWKNIAISTVSIVKLWSHRICLFARVLSFRCFVIKNALWVDRSRRVCFPDISWNCRTSHGASNAGSRSVWYNKTAIFGGPKVCFPTFWWRKKSWKKSLNMVQWFFNDPEVVWIRCWETKSDDEKFPSSGPFCCTIFFEFLSQTVSASTCPFVARTVRRSIKYTYKYTLWIL